MTFAALALPSLQDIPTHYVIRTGDDFLQPLALSLIDSGVINDVDVPKRPTSEMGVCMSALNRHWQEITIGLTCFDWQLELVQDRGEWAAYLGHAEPDRAWAIIRTSGGAVTGRQVSIGEAVMHLETVRVGLGQTVIAALFDAFRKFPLVCTPVHALDMAAYHYWGGYLDEEPAIEEAMRYHGVDTREELFENTDFVSHSEVFGAMPRWAAEPKRTLSRRKVQTAARKDAFARAVVDAMDDLWGVLTTAGPFADLSSPDAGADLIDFNVVIRWSDDDSTGRVIDDFCHYATEGDYIEASSVTSLSIHDNSIAVWLDKMRATARLARAAERVLDLLQSEDFKPARPLIRVFA